MYNRITDLQAKEVINVKDGCRLGSVCDAEVDLSTGQLVSIVIFGRSRFFGLFGREEDIVIKWSSIQMIGDDTILVCLDNFTGRGRKKGKFFGQIFN